MNYIAELNTDLMGRWIRFAHFSGDTDMATMCEAIESAGINVEHCRIFKTEEPVIKSLLSGLDIFAASQAALSVDFTGDREYLSLPSMNSSELRDLEAEAFYSVQDEAVSDDGSVF